ncbi:TetR/AcrR family transcriptional regulator [Nocardia australiensis]|uniref:TetR/AcrR family transcriptional regulator n=1 Tax=Nocardia australiensis TaxID=2887191 RepID=UPI001D134B8A|nr:TetR/AcrR family transcriptional regulator [Nocardia australiensis]
MPSTPRARARAQTMDDILRIGREHLATDGAAALSLRAVARDLGVVSSAVYRYVRSRDELLTLLVVDGYNALGDAVDAALAQAPTDDPQQRLRVLGRAVREWALAEPSWYGLLFGTPVPGYDAPADRTVTPGVRVIAALQQIYGQAYRAGLLAEPAQSIELSSALAVSFGRVRDSFELDVPDWLISRGVTVWSALFGAVSFDVFNMYGPDTFADRAEVFELQLDNLVSLLGFRR